MSDSETERLIITGGSKVVRKSYATCFFVAANNKDAPGVRSKKTYKWLKKDEMMSCNRDLLLKRLPIIGWLRNYSSVDFVADMLAGLTVGLTVIPQGMACAVIAGLPPQVIITEFL